MSCSKTRRRVGEGIVRLRASGGAVVGVEVKVGVGVGVRFSGAARPTATLGCLLAHNGCRA